MEDKKKSPEQELVESIGLMIEKGMETNTNIYMGVVKSVDGKRAVVTVNGQNQNVAIATADVSSGNVVRVFVPDGNMSAAFIIKAEASGGGTTTTSYGDLTGKPKINNVTLVDNLTSKDLGLYGTGNAPPYPVTSVNGQTGDVTVGGGAVDSVNGKTGTVVLTTSDVGALPSDTKIPSKTSDLTNDSGYITNSALSEYAKTSDIPTKTSDLTNDSGYITANDAPVKSVDGQTGAVTTNAVKTTAQALTNAQKAQARANIGAGTSNFSGSYNDLSDKPDIPSKYTLPVANSTTLGGVKPVAKTSDMTQSVGVDANGALYTTPGGGGGSAQFYVNCTISGNNTYDEDVTFNKTYDEIVSAYNSGTTCYALLTVGNETNPHILPLAFIDLNESVKFALTSMSGGDTPEEFEEGYITIFSGGGAEGYWGVRYTSNYVIPNVTTADNGKYYQVVNGQWVAADSQFFICNITASGSTYTCDATPAQILAATTAGRIAIAKYANAPYFLVGLSQMMAQFNRLKGTTVSTFTIQPTGAATLSTVNLQTALDNANGVSF